MTFDPSSWDLGHELVYASDVGCRGLAGGVSRLCSQERLSGWLSCLLHFSLVPVLVLRQFFGITHWNIIIIMLQNKLISYNIKLISVWMYVRYLWYLTICGLFKLVIIKKTTVKASTSGLLTNAYNTFECECVTLFECKRKCLFLWTHSNANVWWLHLNVNVYGCVQMRMFICVMRVIVLLAYIKIYVQFSMKYKTIRLYF